MEICNFSEDRSIAWSWVKRHCRWKFEWQRDKEHSTGPQFPHCPRQLELLLHRRSIHGSKTIDPSGWSTLPSPSPMGAKACSNSLYHSAGNHKNKRTHVLIWIKLQQIMVTCICQRNALALLPWEEGEMEWLELCSWGSSQDWTVLNSLPPSSSDMLAVRIQRDINIYIDQISPQVKDEMKERKKERNYCLN